MLFSYGDEGLDPHFPRCDNHHRSRWDAPVADQDGWKKIEQDKTGFPPPCLERGPKLGFPPNFSVLTFFMVRARTELIHTPHSQQACSLAVLLSQEDPKHIRETSQSIIKLLVFKKRESFYYPGTDVLGIDIIGLIKGPGRILKLAQHKA